MVLKSLLVCTAATSLIVATVPAATSPAQSAKNGMKIVRAYDVWKHHDPAAPQKTVAALEAADAECGASTGPFELLRLTTSREAAADIVRQIDDAGVPRAIEQAYARAFAALPGPSVTVCVYAGELSRGLPYLGGVGGIALGGGRIKLFLHPTREKFARVPYTVAHEYHHEVLRATAPWTSTDDVVIREGKADHFATALYPQLRPPHTAPLSKGELAVVWPAFEAYRRGEGSDFQNDFLIARTGKLPLWAGYRLGFQMVGEYLRTFRGGPREWLTVPAQEMVNAFGRSRADATK